MVVAITVILDEQVARWFLAHLKAVAADRARRFVQLGIFVECCMGPFPG